MNRPQTKVIQKLKPGDRINIVSLDDGRVMMTILRGPNHFVDFNELVGAAQQEDILLCENSRLKANLYYEVER